jgi:2-hydroxychromene-2-carboxylate isomerase
LKLRALSDTLGAVPPGSLDFYFDFISPYAYLAFFRVRQICERRGLALALRPVLFAGLLDHGGQLGPGEIPAKRAWLFKDCLRCARLQGLDFRLPKFHPFNPLTALRLALPEVAGDDQARIVEAIYRAGWGRGGDIGAREELASALAGAGLNAATLLAKTAEPAVKAALKQSTDDAIARGVFGVPTVFVGDELFWGADRLDHVELALDGRDPLAQLDLSGFVDPPRAADRPALLARKR